MELPALQQATSSSSERAPDLPDASPSDSFAGWSALAYAVALPLGVGSFAAGLAFAREENGTNDNIWALASTGIVVAVLLPASVQAAHGQWWGALRTFVGTVLSVAIGFVAYAAISLSTLCIDLSDDDSDDRCRPPDPRVPVIATAAGVLPYVGWAITDVLLWSHE